MFITRSAGKRGVEKRDARGNGLCVLMFIGEDDDIVLITETFTYVVTYCIRKYSIGMHA